MSTSIFYGTAAQTRTTTTIESHTDLYGCPLDLGDHSSGEDLSETVESLHTQTASTSLVHLPPTRSLSTIPTFSRRLGKEILMPLGYKTTIDRWRAAPLSTWYPLLPSEITLPSPPPAVAPLPPEYIESVGDDLETLRASLAFAMQEMMIHRARVGLLEHTDGKGGNLCVIYARGHRFESQRELGEIYILVATWHHSGGDTWHPDPTRIQTRPDPLTATSAATLASGSHLLKWMPRRCHMDCHMAWRLANGWLLCGTDKSEYRFGYEVQKYCIGCPYALF
nr:hypothetical protein [Tanacetum cinerariifolium]